MNRTNITIGVVSIVFVAGIAYWEMGGLTSPGDLHPSHARVASLRGSAGCTACHGDESRSMDEACIDCHEIIGTHIETASGLHGTMDASVPASACQQCHAEHTKGTIALVSSKSFETAGIPERNTYHHEHIENFPLTGIHRDLACSMCHVAADEYELREGQTRFLGLVSSCTACHEDSHNGEYGADCASCHGQEYPFNVAAAFEHTPDFPLVDSHAGVSCKACHEEGTAYAIVSPQNVVQTTIRACAACHESPHSKTFIDDITMVERSAGDVCMTCHAVEHEDFLYPEATLTLAQHAASGFVLDPPHATQDCSQCHAFLGERDSIDASSNTQAEYGVLFPGRSNENCRACHEDPHQGQFDSAEQLADCLSCHDGQQFVPGLFDVTMHARTDFALTGKHLNATCADCHTEMDGHVQYAQTPMSCAACHDDPHDGQFQFAASGDDCSTCHDDNRFEATRFVIEDHQKTMFPLTGAHQAVACRSCHTDDNGIRQFVGTAKDCAACHEDVHNGVFDGPGLPVMVNGETGCARCHSTDSFDAIDWTGDMHEQWTGTALVGAHARAACADCHGTGRGGPGRSFKITSTECVACHTDEHVGQFVVMGVNDCARCHSERNAFSTVTFDHQRDSRFPLDEQHTDVMCAQCHQPSKLANGAFVTRYRPLGHECQDCHGFRSLDDRNVQ